MKRLKKLQAFKMGSMGAHFNCGMELGGFGYGRDHVWDREKERYVFVPEFPVGTVWSWDVFTKKYKGWLAPIVVFSGNIEQKHPLGPSAFARWLRKEGEKVTKTMMVDNPTGSRGVQGFMWTPSQKFKDQYRQVKDAQRQQDSQRSG